MTHDGEVVMARDSADDGHNNVSERGGLTKVSESDTEDF